MYRLPTIAAILFYWITMKAVQQLTGLTLAGPMVRPIRPVSCWTRPRYGVIRYTLTRERAPLFRNTAAALAEVCAAIWAHLVAVVVVVVGVNTVSEVSGLWLARWQEFLFKITSWFTNKIVRCCPMLCRRGKYGCPALSPAFMPFIKSILSQSLHSIVMGKS